MTSIIDEIEAAGPATELTELLRELDAFDPHAPDSGEREHRLDVEVARVLTQTLSAGARRELATMLMPAWANGQLFGNLNKVRLTGVAWPVIVGCLAEHGLVPILHRVMGVVNVWPLSHLLTPGQQSPRRSLCSPCSECSVMWAETPSEQEELVCRTCFACNRITQVNPAQGTLW